MTSRDDMVITPVLRPKAGKKVRARAQEERKTARTKTTRDRDRRRWRRRSKKAKGRTPKAAPRPAPKAPAAGKKITKKGIFRGTARSLGRILGAGALVAEGTILMGQMARFAGGKSIRMIEAEDAHDLFRDLDEKSTAAASARAYIESRPNLLYIIGVQNKDQVNDEVYEIFKDKERDALDKARGADKLGRDPAFDSDDTVAGRVLRQTLVEANAVKEKLKQMIRALFETGKTPTRTGR